MSKISNEHHDFLYRRWLSTISCRPQVLGEGDRKEHPSIGHQAAVVKEDLNVVERSRGSTYSVRLISVRFWNYKTIIPEAQEHFPAYTPCCNTSSIGGLGLSPADTASAAEIGSDASFRVALRSQLTRISTVWMIAALRT